MAEVCCYYYYCSERRHRDVLEISQYI